MLYESACRRPACCPTWRVCREEVCLWLTAPLTVRWRRLCHDQQVSCLSRLRLKELISCFSLQPTSTFSTRRSSSSTWSRSGPTTACRYAAAVCDTPLKIWAAEPTPNPSGVLSIKIIRYKNILAWKNVLKCKKWKKCSLFKGSLQIFLIWELSKIFLFLIWKTFRKSVEASPFPVLLMCCVCVCVCPDLPRWGALPVAPQPHPADLLADWLFQRLSAWLVIVTQPTATGRRVRRVSVCVFSTVAARWTDQTSCQIRIK